MGKRWITEFVREYFEDNENERIAAELALYERERVTLGGASRLADVVRWTMRDILREHGVELRLGLTNKDDVKRRTSLFLNYFSDTQAETADEWLRKFAFAWNHLI